METRAVAISLSAELENALVDAANAQSLSLADYLGFCIEVGLLLSYLLNDPGVEVIIKRNGKEERMVLI